MLEFGEDLFQLIDQFYIINIMKLMSCEKNI